MSQIPGVIDVNIEDARVYVEQFLKNDTPIMIWGDTGIGKSSLIDQIKTDWQWGMVDVRGSTRDAVDFMGTPFPDKENAITRWLPPGDLPRVETHGEHGILFLDEITNSNISVQAAMFQLILDRCIGDYVLPKGWRIVAAGNRTSDRSAANRMAQALANRMAHMNMVPDVGCTQRHWQRIGVHPVMIDAIGIRHELLHFSMDSKIDRNKLGPAVNTPRSLEEASKYVDTPKSHRLNMLACCIGQSAAAEIEAMIEVHGIMPDWRQCVASPHTAPVPERADVKYAIASELARHADHQNLGNIMAYLKRLPDEYHTTAVCDAIRRDESLQKTRAFVDWAVEYSNVTY